MAKISKVKCIETGLIFENQKVASIYMNIPRKSINKVVTGRNKTTHGYTFKKISDDEVKAYRLPVIMLCDIQPTEIDDVIEEVPTYIKREQEDISEVFIEQQEQEENDEIINNLSQSIVITKEEELMIQHNNFLKRNNMTEQEYKQYLNEYLLERNITEEQLDLEIKQFIADLLMLGRDAVATCC